MVLAAVQEALIREVSAAKGTWGKCGSCAPPAGAGPPDRPGRGGRGRPLGAVGPWWSETTGLFPWGSLQSRAGAGSPAPFRLLSPVKPEGDHGCCCRGARVVTTETPGDEGAAGSVASYPPVLGSRSPAVLTLPVHAGCRAGSGPPAPGSGVRQRGAAGFRGLRRLCRAPRAAGARSLASAARTSLDGAGSVPPFPAQRGQRRCRRPRWASGAVGSPGRLPTATWARVGGAGVARAPSPRCHALPAEPPAPRCTGVPGLPPTASTVLEKHNWFSFLPALNPDFPTAAAEGPDYGVSEEAGEL